MILALESGSRMKLGGLLKDTKGSEEITTEGLRIRDMSYGLWGAGGSWMKNC